MFDQGMEFSYQQASNPNTNGYDYVAQSVESSWGGYISKRSPQTQTNSVVVRVKERTDAGVLVDILLAPFEAVVSPGQGERYEWGEPINIQWTTDYSLGVAADGIIDIVDIFYESADGTKSREIASGVAAADSVYEWVPDDSYFVGEGRVRVVSHNVRAVNDTTRIGDDICDGTFEITPPSIVVFSDLNSTHKCNSLKLG